MKSCAPATAGKDSRSVKTTEAEDKRRIGNPLRRIGRKRYAVQRRQLTTDVDGGRDCTLISPLIQPGGLLLVPVHRCSNCALKTLILLFCRSTSSIENRPSAEPQPRLRPLIRSEGSAATPAETNVPGLSG